MRIIMFVTVCPINTRLDLSKIFDSLKHPYNILLPNYNFMAIAILSYVVLFFYP